MSECTTKKYDIKTYIILAMSVFIAFAVKTLITYLFDVQIIGWFFFGLISVVGILLAYKEKGNRFITVNIIFIIVVSAVTAGLNYLLSL